MGNENTTIKQVLESSDVDVNAKDELNISSGNNNFVKKSVKDVCGDSIEPVVDANNAVYHAKAMISSKDLSFSMIKVSEETNSTELSNGKDNADKSMLTNESNVMNCEVETVEDNAVDSVTIHNTEELEKETNLI